MSSVWSRALVFGLFMLSGLVSAGEAHAPAALALTVDNPTATAGFYKVSWQPATDAVSQRFELQEARDADFTQPLSVYNGPDHARTFSGRADGTYYYRLRIAQPNAQPNVQPHADWSVPVHVQVAHHSLTRAWIFFAMGAVVFLATLFLILSTPKEDTHP